MRPDLQGGANAHKAHSLFVGLQAEEFPQGHRVQGLATGQATGETHRLRLQQQWIDGLRRKAFVKIY